MSCTVYYNFNTEMRKRTQEDDKRKMMEKIRFGSSPQSDKSTAVIQHVSG